MDGLEASHQIRNLPGYETIPILAITANAFAEDKTKCFAVGMDGILTKPVNPEQLYDHLLRVLERNSSVHLNVLLIADHRGFGLDPS